MKMRSVVTGDDRAGRAPRRRTNRRGQATRENMLEAALRSLASGDPGSVSANRIAKDIGATWGAVQVPVRRHRRVLGRRAAPHRRAPRPTCSSTPSTRTRPLRERVAAIIDMLYRRPDARRIRGRSRTCARHCPATAPNSNGSTRRPPPNCHSWGQSWLETCQNGFADLDVDPERVREVATFIPGAMRGLVSERQLGSYADLDVARRGLTNALVAYLEHSRM